MSTADGWSGCWCVFYIEHMVWGSAVIDGLNHSCLKQLSCGLRWQRLWNFVVIFFLSEAVWTSAHCKGRWNDKRLCAASRGIKKDSAGILANHDFNKWHIGRMCLQGHSRSQTSRRDASICLFGNLSEGYCRRHAHTGCRYTKWRTPAEPLHVYWGQEFISFLLEEKWTVMTRAEKWAARDFILSVCI